MSAVNYRLAGDVAILEVANPPVNALSLAVREGLMEGLERAVADPAVVAVVISGAEGTFPAGADINEIASGLALKAPMILDVQARMEAVRKPLIAALEGNALGGGFELALTCHWRVATPATRVGLPEVKLGLIDAVAADAVTAAAELGRQAVREGRPLRLASDLDEHIRGVSSAPFAAFRQKIATRARGQLAPWKIIDCIEAACTRSKAEAFRFERDCFIECRDSAQRRALTHLFFAEREARRIPGIGPEVKPRSIASAAVIGAGTMGGGIAMNFANAGIPVRLLELSAEALERGLALVRKNYAASVSRGSLTEERAERALALIRGVTDYAELSAADILIEAVFEDLKVKQEVFARLDGVAAPGAILATNTSTLDIDAIAASTSRPQQVVGTHFFSPANVMKLLENVRGARSAPQVIATVMALGQRLGKVAVLAGNCDGFIGNRMLGFYGLEAEFLLEEGATPEQIDRVIEGFGFAMGPLAVRDLAGNDVGFLIRKSRKLPADERFSPILERLVGAGRLGQKSGAGFYRYEGRTRIPDPKVLELIEQVSRDLGIERRAIPDAEILERLLHPLVNEGARIVEEGIALRTGDVDVVYVNGYGFPAWRGGPMYWAAQTGLERVVATMQRLARTHGARWGPAPLLQRQAAAGSGWGA